MKIVILGLITVAFTNVAIAAPSDKGGKDDMILEQMKDLRHKLQQQQHVIKELKEEQLQLKEEQVRRDEDQQYKMEELKEKQERRIAEQERRVEEVTRVRRSEKETVEHLKKLVNSRRSDDEIVEDLKKFIHAEIKPMIEGLSECAIGSTVFSHGASSWGVFDETQTVLFGRNFTRVPKVVASLAGYQRKGNELEGDKNLFVEVESTTTTKPTTTKFELRVYTNQMNLHYARATWVACA